jgi:2-amino-4-hydroxy-6-hydroxymethyldihydropteridine diphosphokinase
VVDTSLTPDDLLGIAQRCERRAGRVREVRWGPRTLDVDVLAYDAVELESPTLTLPHPRAAERAFVMVPWAAVDPDFVVFGRRVAEWAQLLDGSGVRLVEGTG